MAHLDGQPWVQQQTKRRVQHYGAVFDFVNRTATLPSAAATGTLRLILDRIAAGGYCGDAGQLSLPPSEQLEPVLMPPTATSTCSSTSSAGCYSPIPSEQATVNEYARGQGIAAHVDNHAAFQDGLVSLSLGSGVVMDFSQPGGGGATHAVYLPRRSLLVLRGEARFEWLHGIASRTTDTLDGAPLRRGERRVSVTVRRSRRQEGDPCRCAWPATCASQSGGSQSLAPGALLSPLLQARAQRGVEVAGAAAIQPPPPPPLSHAAAPSPLRTPPLEALHVHALYETIAEHFSHTRHSQWPRVAAFLADLPTGTLLLDVGCGNAKYIAPLRPPHVAAIGCDRSAALMAIAGGARGCEGAVADAVGLPFRSGVADVVLCVAVLHHISTRARRVALIRELLRVAAPAGGRVFIQAWAREQGADSRRSFEGGGQDALVPWCLHRRFVSGDDAGVAAAGGVLDTARNAVVFQRYVHAYAEGELEELVGEAIGVGGADSVGIVAGRSGGVEEGGGLVEGGITLAPLQQQQQQGSQVQAEGGPKAATTPSLVVDGSQLMLGGGGKAVGGARGPRIVDRWYDRDNWCVIIEMGSPL